jgi:SAM-dependent methyltransferase
MDQWSQISERFNEWTAPLRPSQEDVALFKNSLRPRDRVLLLGVTPELLPLSNVAIDKNPNVIAAYRDKAIFGDWRDLPFEAEFDAVIGDGCLTVFQGTPAHFFQQVRKVVKDEGSITLRLFISPEEKESLDEVVRTKEQTGFHAFKWRVAHALANPYVTVKKLYDVIFPIWPHPTLEVYQESDLVYYFPKLSELDEWSDIQFSSSYELASRCPVVTWNLPKKVRKSANQFFLPQS